MRTLTHCVLLFGLVGKVIDGVNPVNPTKIIIEFETQPTVEIPFKLDTLLSLLCRYKTLRGHPNVVDPHKWLWIELREANSATSWCFEAKRFPLLET